MKQYRDYRGDEAHPVIDFRRRNRYVDGAKTDTMESVYTILRDYEQIDVAVEDNGKIISQQQVRNAADEGTPIMMNFHDLEITVRGKSPWEVQPTGRASQVTMPNNGK
ncbi:MAG: hypothetical protein HDT38_02715 [Clostridiales bacterium]|nr:hypothetical protein [Clostridiales bacterium]